jgi:D-xylose transport system permease protein
MSKPFLSVSNWAQMATASTFLLAAAAGLTLVLVIGEIDLSIGSIAYMAATVAFLMSDYPLVMTIAAALGVGLLTGLFNGWLVAYLGMNSLSKNLVWSPRLQSEKISTVRRRRSKPLNPSTLVGGGSVDTAWNFKLLQLL